MVTLVRIALRLIEDALRRVVLLFRSTESVHAELPAGWIRIRYAPGSQLARNESSKEQAVRTSG